MKRTLVAIVCLLGILTAAPGRAEETTDLTTAIEKVAENVGPSVVSIRTEVVQHYRPRYYSFGSQFEDELFNRFFEDFFGEVPDQELKRSGLGSGVIIDKEGYILTNEHVVAGADKIVVSLPDGRSFPATLKGTDPRSDLAIIKITAPDLPTARLGNSEDLKIGQWVVAIGNPFGHILNDPQPTFTTGVISALHRSLPRSSRRDTDYSDLIQTDAAINPGNSGGPLVDLKGEIVGINVAIFSTSGGYQGIGFAIPSNYVKSIVEQLVQGKEVEYGWVGVAIQDVDERLAGYFGLPDTDGVLILKVMPGGPAERSGLKEGDIVLSLNELKVRDTSGFIKYIGNAPLGKKINALVLRDNQRLTIPLEISRRPDFRALAAAAKVEMDKAPVEAKVWRGLKVTDITETMARTMRIDNPQGVFVTEIETQSPAAESGLRKGDVIIAINRSGIRNVQDFNDVTGKSAGECLIRTLRGYFVVKAPNPESDEPER